MTGIGWCIALALCAAARAQEALPLVIPPGETRTVTVAARAGDAVLLVEGRFMLPVEHRAAQGIRLRLNGEAVEGLARVHGATAAYLPWRAANWDEYPLPRFTAEGGYAFPVDSDYLRGNRYFRSGRDVSYIAGCPHRLQLDARELLKAGENTLVIANGGELPFEARRLACLPAPEADEEPLLASPHWKYFFFREDARARYRRVAEDTETAPEQRAHLLAALGTAELMRPDGDRQQALADCARALATGAAFPLRGEAAYRLAADRVLAGRWPTPESEALVRAVATGSDAWAELTRALLDLIDGKETSARPVIRPRLVRETITPDGILDEACWQDARVYPLAIPMGYTRLKGIRTEVRFAVTAEGLAVAFDGELPARTTWTVEVAHDAPVWEDNCVEFFLAPDVDMRVYYEFGVTPRGARFDARNRWVWILHPEWNGAWRAGHRMEEMRFAVEMVIPWADLGLHARPQPGHLFVIAAARYAIDTTGPRRATGFFTLTRHREYDCHRLMDGALLIMP